MKNFIHILILFLSIALVVKPASASFPDDIDPSEYALPMACGGSVEEYFVAGFNGFSIFEWQLFYNHNDGATVEDVTDKYLTHINNGDTVLVSWPNDPNLGGIYTFAVIEQSQHGCIGEVYTQDVILNNGSIFVPLDNVNQFFQVCSGDQVGIFPGDQFQNYLWLDDDDQPDADGQDNTPYLTGDAGTYKVQIFDYFTQDNINFQNTYSCTYDTIGVTVRPLPEIDLGPNQALIGAQTLLLDATQEIEGIDDLLEDDVSYSWFDYNFNQQTWNDLNIPNSYYEVEGGSGDQWIKVNVYYTFINDIYYETELTCSASDSIYIEAADYSKFRIPKAFIPESEIAENQKWYFPAPSEAGTDLYPYLEDVDVRVFNRHGRLVWQSSGMFQAWDGRDLGGRPLPMDSYHYIIRIRVDGEVFVYKGNVTIIR